MAQPTTNLLDTAIPTFQDLAFSSPIFWTASRTYAFALQTGLGTNKAAFYLSLDGGITWSNPDLTHATVSNGEAVYWWDGSTNVCNIAILPSSGGSQSMKLQDFDLNAQTYNAAYGAVGPPTGTFHSLGSINRMADGSLMVFYDKNTSGINYRAYVAIFQSGAWATVDLDFATNVPGVFSQWEGAVPDPANNLCHVFYTDTLGNWFYRQITSAGVLGAITAFPAGFNIATPNLNFGRAFCTGYLRSGNLYVPVFTKAAGIFSISEITGVPASAPVFSIATVDTAANATIGSDPGSAIGLHIGTTDYVAYFIGDGTNKYNLVKLATNSGLGWSTQLVYDATADPNAAVNPHNNQWLNSISATVDPSSGFQYQFATWHAYPGDPNLTILSTAFSGGSSLTIGCGSPPVGQLSQAYSSAVSPAGGTPPYTFAIIAGALPTGLTLNVNTGVISGSPTAKGLFHFTVQVTDSLSATASVACSISIIPLLPSFGVGGMGCLPECVDPCAPYHAEQFERFWRVLARGAIIFTGGQSRG